MRQNKREERPRNPPGHQFGTNFQREAPPFENLSTLASIWHPRATNWGQLGASWASLGTILGHLGCHWPPIGTIHLYAKVAIGAARIVAGGQDDSSDGLFAADQMGCRRC